jgi:hypothetical protein
MDCATSVNHDGMTAYSWLLKELKYSVIPKHTKKLQVAATK